MRIANHADMTGGRCALIAPQPQVAKLLLICHLNQRLRAVMGGAGITDPRTGHEERRYTVALP